MKVKMTARPILYFSMVVLLLRGIYIRSPDDFKNHLDVYFSSALTVLLVLDLYKFMRK